MMSATKFVITQCTVTLNVLTEVDKNYSPVNVPRSCGCLIGQFFLKQGRENQRKKSVTYVSAIYQRTNAPFSAELVFLELFVNNARKRSW